MNVIKQKGQDYASFQMRLETVLDGLLYHPMNRRHYQKCYEKGVYYRRFRRMRGTMQKKIGTLKGLNLHCTGVSHLDAAWLFPVVDTKIRAYKTFFKAVEHCEEFPFLTFSQTTPQYFAWIKAYDKQLWQKVKQKVMEGRIEITGGMWVEPSLDMPSGEALVRQRLYGQLFFLREFGHYPTMASLLDVFGFPWSMPQIFKKSGAEYFWTTKDSGGVPFNTFYWRGIDGTEIFTHQFNYNWDALLSADNFREKARFPKDRWNQSPVDSHTPREKIQNMFSEDPEDYNPNFALFYGLGDGGRGPLELEVMFADALKKLQNGTHGSQHGFMKKLKETQGDRYFVWDDEKYLNYHRGVKTTQVEVKHYNRLGESYANSAETIQSWYRIMSGKGKEQANQSQYKQTVFEMWRKILFNQFHDILPGSSIPDVYELAVKEQKSAINTAKKLIEEVFTRLKESLEIEKGELLLFNPFSWSRNVLLYHEKNWYFLKAVPPLAIFFLDKTNRKNCQKIPVEHFGTVSTSSNGIQLENENIKASIDTRFGSLTSLSIKENGYNLIDVQNSAKKIGSGLRVYRENPNRWKAWNLDKNYPLKKVLVKVKGRTRIENDAKGIQWAVTDYKFLNSRATTKFALLPKEDYLRFEIKTDIRDPEILIKYFLPLNLNSEKVCSDIPYAHISRKRVKRTRAEKQKWEMNMQKWVDVSDQEYGLSIFNKNRYGFSATTQGLYITIQRTPKYPGVSPLYGSTRTIPPNQRPNYTDMKPLEFKFAFFPHNGTKSTNKSEITKHAFEFNHPVLQFNRDDVDTKVKVKANDLSKEFLTKPLVQLSQDNIRVGTLKLPESKGKMLDIIGENKDWEWNGNFFILRLVEMCGKDSVLTLKFNEYLSIRQIYEVDLLERDPKELNAPIGQREKLSIPIKPFEIKTLLIRFVHL